MQRQYILSLWAFLLLSGMVVAQPINTFVKNGVLPAPNVAAIGKYTDIPISYLTGVPNISIPIHTVQNGPLSLPVGLSYHASGIKLAETASWVGLGWSLQAGGMVTRQIAGIPDDNGSNGYYGGYSTNMENTFAAAIPQNSYISLKTCYGITTSEVCANFAETSYTDMANNIETGAVDGEPDVFSFNFAGYSGKFVFDKNKNVVLIPKQDIKIEVSPTTGARFDRFTITTPDGTRYHFGNTPGGALNYTEKTYPSLQSQPSYYSSWYLAQVESHDGKFQINLSYTSEQTGYRQPGFCSYTITSAPSSSGDAVSCVGGFEDSYHPFQDMTVVGQRLTQITTSTESVVFVASQYHP